MAHTISKTGGATVELGTWVASTGNAAYSALLDMHAAALTAGAVPAQSDAFDAMVNAFLVATNQEIAQ